jgi:glycerol kinase
MSSFVGSIDQGTTSSRFLIFDEKGILVTFHQEEFNQHYPQPGWFEHNPYDLIHSVVQCIKVAVEKFELLGHKVSDIKSVGITNQRETTVVWDKTTGKPLYNAIVWADTRTQATVHALNRKHPLGAQSTQAQCGLPITTYFSAVKLRWMIDNVPIIKESHEKETALFGTVDSWLIYNLTGGVNGGIHVTDVTNASRTMFMNINTLKWDHELLNFFGVKRAILPKIVSSSEIYGNIIDGPLKGVPIAGCLGDQQAALVGQKCFAVGEAKNTYGTGCFMLFNTGTTPVISKNGLLTTVGYQFGPQSEPVYALEGSIAVSGAAVKWIRDNLGLIKDADESGQLAATVKDTGGVYFVTAFSGLFAPYWRDDARGCIVGLTQFTNKAHIARATLEASCFQTRAILDAMNKDSGKPLTSLKVDGGMTNSDICMQIQADLLGIEVDRPLMRETTALGAAIAAGFAVGVWKDLTELQNVNIEGRTLFKSQITRDEREARFSEWQRAVERSYGWVEMDGSK